MKVGSSAPLPPPPSTREALRTFSEHLPMPLGCTVLHKCISSPRRSLYRRPLPAWSLSDWSGLLCRSKCTYQWSQGSLLVNGCHHSTSVNVAANIQSADGPSRRSVVVWTPWLSSLCRSGSRGPVGPGSCQFWVQLFGHRALRRQGRNSTSNEPAPLPPPSSYIFS